MERCPRTYRRLWNWNGTLERIHHALYVAVREQDNRGLIFPLIKGRGLPLRCSYYERVLDHGIVSHQSVDGLVW